MNPKEYSTYLELAYLYEKDGSIQKAEECWETALSTCEDDYRFSYAADFYKRIGKQDKAIELYNVQHNGKYPTGNKVCDRSVDWADGYRWKSRSRVWTISSQRHSAKSYK